MNLYSIYDSETGQCLGKDKTAGQIEKLFGVKQSGVYKSATRGHILNGKYRIEFVGRVLAGEKISDAETIAWMKEWEQVTENIRAHFRKIRRQQERTVGRYENGSSSKLKRRCREKHDSY